MAQAFQVGRRGVGVHSSREWVASWADESSLAPALVRRVFPSVLVGWAVYRGLGFRGRAWGVLWVGGWWADESSPALVLMRRVFPSGLVESKKGFVRIGVV